MPKAIPKYKVQKPSPVYGWDKLPFILNSFEAANLCIFTSFIEISLKV
jgi:hypothetical protein